MANDAEIGIHLDRQQTVTIATQALTQEEYDGYYLGYSNRALWPVFHYRLDLAVFDTGELERYKAVNQRMARSLAGLLTEDDIVWIHDYHMVPLGAELRRLGVKNRMGFFLHIPFPPPEIVTAVPDHEWLIDSLFAYDVIGFQTEQDVQNFYRYVEQSAGEVSENTHPFRAEGREPLVKAYPIGIDADAFAAMATTPEAESRIRQLVRGSIRNHIIGVDRLDYSKGLPDRFRSFRKLLEAYPDHRKETVLMQIAPPTREELAAYSEIRTELEQLSGRHQRRIRRLRLDADPLCPPGGHARHAGGAVPRLEDRAGDAAPRRHEPGRQGICRGAGRGQSGRARALAIRRRRGGPQGSDHRQPARPGRGRHRHRPGDPHAAGRTAGAPPCALHPRPRARRRRLAQRFSGRPDGRGKLRWRRG